MDDGEEGGGDALGGGEEGARVEVDGDGFDEFRGG
jgi:hypothetical protein